MSSSYYCDNCGDYIGEGGGVAGPRQPGCIPPSNAIVSSRGENFWTRSASSMDLYFCSDRCKREWNANNKSESTDKTTDPNRVQRQSDSSDIGYYSDSAVSIRKRAKRASKINESNNNDIDSLESSDWESDLTSDF